MKKILVTLTCLMLLLSCKPDKKGPTLETNNTVKAATLLTGDFVYYADAAVLQTKTQIYGVIINDKMHELNKQAQKFKKEPTDMVTVEVRGVVEPKAEDEEGWDYLVNIKEIIKVSAIQPENNQVIKIQ
jgi:hypothetical protein